VQGIVRVQRRRLDPTYPKRGAAEFGVDDLLDRALRDAG